MVDAATQLLQRKILLTCQGHVAHVDCRRLSDRTREGMFVTVEEESERRRGREEEAQCDCLVLW